MDDERMQILRMLEAGKVNSEEAAKLLDAVETRVRPGEGVHKKKLRIVVTDPATNKSRLNLTLPIGLARFAAKFIPPHTKQKMTEEGIDIDEIVSQVVAENSGKVVDIVSDQGKIEITIE
jgi:hypothetical protein